MGAIPTIRRLLILELRHRERAMSNPLPPDLISADERLNEVARLLALGYLRLRVRRQGKKPMIRTT
jgi:hypothetical protein